MKTQEIQTGRTEGNFIYRVNGLRNSLPKDVTETKNSERELMLTQTARIAPGIILQIQITRTRIFFFLA